MAIRVNEPTIDKNILDAAPVEPPMEPVVEDVVIEDPSQITEQETNIVNTDNTQGEIKLAGMGNVIFDTLKSAKDAVVDTVSDTVLSSEKKVYGSMKATEEITDMGGFVLVKPSEDIKLDDLLDTILEGKNPGINFVKLGEKLNLRRKSKGCVCF